MTTDTVYADKAAQGDGFARHKVIFCIITLCVLGMLLSLHVQFAAVLGEPSVPVIGLLGIAFVLTIAELLWLRQRSSRLTDREARIESCISIAVIFALTAVLTYVTNRDENPYFVLLAIPILQCAYSFRLLATILTIAAADSMIMFWIWHFFELHPPARPTQFLDGGMLCAVYLIMGVLAWLLVNQLKTNQLKLRHNLDVLRATRERLIAEEKFAAIGRLASGVAHEIRNPVAMISSSLSTAIYPGTDPEEREEMFAIAARESKRLESLTADFLTYAKPSPVKRSPALINDLLSYIAAVTRAHAASRAITITSEVTDDLLVEIDSPQIEGAILNLVLNAIDATPNGGFVRLSASSAEDLLSIHVEDSGSSIPDPDLAQIFEPFFTTKPTGTGLGLAIARGAAIAHGGDLLLTNNRDGCVTFSLTIMRSTANEA